MAKPIHIIRWNINPMTLREQKSDNNQSQNGTVSKLNNIRL